MKLREVLEAIEGKVISKNVDLDEEVQMGCGADLMSDVLAFTHEGTLLMSGLTNPQVVRRAVRLADWPPSAERVSGVDELLEHWVVQVADRPDTLTGELQAAASLLCSSRRTALEAACDGASQLRQRESASRLDRFDGVLAAGEVQPRG